MTIPITKQDVPGPEIARIVNAMQEVFGDEDRTAMMMACLSMALILQHEDISMDDLKDGVLGASEWIALFLTSLEEQEEGGLDPMKVN